MQRAIRPGIVLALVLLIVGVSPSRRAPAAGLPGTRWYFAEGTSLPGWTEYLTLLNPGGSASLVRLQYVLEGVGGIPEGALETETWLGPGERRTIDVGLDPLHGGAGRGFTGVATVVESSEPVVVERPMYFTAAIPGIGTISGAHVAAGVMEPRSLWFFAEGTTLPGFREFLALFNPGDADALVQISYFLEGSSLPVVRSVAVSAGARRTIDVSGIGEGALGTIAPGVAVVVDAGPSRIVAERPIYVSRSFGGRGVVSGATIGSPAPDPAAVWTFAEGTTLDSFAEYLTILNTGGGEALVSLDYRLENGIAVSRVCTVPAYGRVTVTVFDPTLPCGLGRDLANGTLGEGVASTLRVLSGPGVVAERAVYFASNGRSGAHSALGIAGDLAGEWFFAEGTTRPGFKTFWTIDNPYDTALGITISYVLDPTTAGSAARIDRSVFVPPMTRITVRADDSSAGGLGSGFDFGARVASTDRRGFAVERPVYVDAPGLSDAHVGSGVALAPKEAS